MRAHHATAQKGNAATGRASASRHEDPAALLTVGDLTDCGPMKAIDLGRREREVTPLARTSDETCHADPTEAATQRLVLGEKGRGHTGRERCPPGSRLGDLHLERRRRSADLCLEHGALGGERRTLGVDPSQLGVERLRCLEDSELDLLELGSTAVERLDLRRHRLLVAVGAGRAAARALVDRRRARDERGGLSLELLLAYRQRRALGGDAATRAVHLREAGPYEVESRLFRQVTATVGELVRRGVRVLEREQ